MRFSHRMKNKIVEILAVLLIIFIATNVSAQIIKGEAIAGLNLTQVDGDEVFGFHKFGLNLGAGAMIPFGKKGRWDVTLETLYSQKGSSQRPQYNETDSTGVDLTGEYKLRLNYVEVPLLVMFTDKELISFGAGFSWGRLFGVKEWEHGRLVESTTLRDGPYSKNDFSALADIRIRLLQALKINLRYQYSLTKIRTREFKNESTGDTWTRNQFNNVITLRMIYVINEKRSRENFKNAQ